MMPLPVDRAASSPSAATAEPLAAARLRVLLRLFGSICLLALVPLFMPRQWIDRGHRLLGWGAFPDEPIAEYLARSTSALCAFLGGLAVFLSLDVRRYAPAARYLAAAVLGYSAAGVAMGIPAGIPLWFTLCDFVGCVLFCVPIWVLAGCIRQEIARAPGPY